MWIRTGREHKTGLSWSARIGFQLHILVLLCSILVLTKLPERASYKVPEKAKHRPLHVWFLSCRKQFSPGNSMAAKRVSYLRRKHLCALRTASVESAYALGNVQTILVIAIWLVHLLSMFFFSFTPVASERMDVLYGNMSLPDLTEWAGIEAIKQVMGKQLGKFGKNAESVLCLITKLGKRIILKHKRTWLW